MAYKQRFDARKFDLRDLFLITLAVAVVVAIATYTDWLLAIMGVAVPLFGRFLSSLSIKAKTESGSLWLARSGALILAFWVVFLAFPMIVWALSYLH